MDPLQQNRSVYEIVKQQLTDRFLPGFVGCWGFYGA